MNTTTAMMVIIAAKTIGDVYVPKMKIRIVAIIGPKSAHMLSVDCNKPAAVERSSLVSVTDFNAPT